MSKKYIELDSAIKHLRGECVTKYPISFSNGISAAANELGKLPVADVVAVVYGEWIWDPDGNDWGIGAWKCSICRVKNDNLGITNDLSPYLYAGSKWCPHCGAKMVKRRDQSNG